MRLFPNIGSLDPGITGFPGGRFLPIFTLDTSAAWGKDPKRMAPGEWGWGRSQLWGKILNITFWILILYILFGEVHTAYHFFLLMLGRKFMFSGSKQDPNNHSSSGVKQQGVHPPISNLEDRYQGSRRWIIFFQNTQLDPWEKFYILASWKLTYPYTVCHFWRCWFSQLPVWWRYVIVP